MIFEREQLKGVAVGVVFGLLIFGFATLFFDHKQATLLGLVAFMVVLWTNEALPLAVVSMLPIILFPAFGILDTKATSLNYANPIVFLFLGGFFLAIGVEKTQLHIWIANKILSFFPSTPRAMIFSLGLTALLLSSILSNTTTTLLLISIALYLTNERELKLRFALTIAYASSIGGILTPIGTAPNLILLGFMQANSLEVITFFEWIFMVAPLCFLMLFAMSGLLGLGLKKSFVSCARSEHPLTFEQKKVLLLLGLLVAVLLLNAPMRPYWSGLGLSESGILLGFGLLLFLSPFKVLEWMQDKENIPFRIMFLFGAGFSIAAAFSATGLADALAIYLIAMTDLEPILLLFAVAALITFATEITSNTALISIMLPVIYALCVQSGIDERLFMMVATLCASYAFMLPIATPPNAIAMSSGVVDVRTMLRFGFVLNLIAIGLIVFIAEYFWKGMLL